MQDWLAQRARISPEKLALSYSDQRWSYTALHAWADEIVGALTLEGLKPGEHAGILMGNRPEYIVLIHAFARLGVVEVPLNQRLAGDELAWQISHADCNYVICDDTTESAAMASCGTDCKILNVDSFVLHKPDGVMDLPHFQLENTQGIFYTSGTSGRPKGAMLNYRNHFWSAAASAYRLGVLPEDRWLLTVPLCHIGGQAIVFRACQYGIAIVLQDQFEVQDVIYALENLKLTLVSLVPTMLRRLIGRYDDWHLADSLRGILLGGAAASDQLIADCVEKNLPVYLTYGLTEASSQVATALPQMLNEKPGTVGKPLKFSEVSIVDEQGNEMPNGQIGEILVSGLTVMQGYYKQQDESEDALAGDALHTGDLGYLDEDGDLWLVSRRTDLIVSGGENVYPVEVERVLLRHPNVSQVCVFGLEDEEWGQQVAAAVVAEPLQVTQEEIIEFGRQYLAGYKLPRVIRFFDQLPQTASGKVRRQTLIEQIERSPVAN